MKFILTQNTSFSRRIRNPTFNYFNSDLRNNYQQNNNINNNNNWNTNNNGYSFNNSIILIYIIQIELNSIIHILTTVQMEI